MQASVFKKKKLIHKKKELYILNYKNMINNTKQPE